ncbi:MAG: hypothetical protein NTV01_01835, partial [Bacteroidia bacterium]|nr:hypothetical protein [Bacteroidia bacterium]
SAITSKLDDDTFSGKIEQESTDILLNNQTGKFNSEQTHYSIWTTGAIEHSRIRLYEWYGTDTVPDEPLFDGLIQGGISYPDNMVASIVVVSKLDILRDYYPFAQYNFPFGSPYFNGGLISGNYMLKVIRDFIYYVFYLDNYLELDMLQCSLKDDILMDSQNLRSKSAYEIFEQICSDSGNIGGITRSGTIFLTHFGASAITPTLPTNAWSSNPYKDYTLYSWYPYRNPAYSTAVNLRAADTGLNTHLYQKVGTVGINLEDVIYKRWSDDLTPIWGNLTPTVPHRSQTATAPFLTTDKKAIFSGNTMKRYDSALFGVSMVLRTVKNQILCSSSIAHENSVWVDPISGADYACAVDFETNADVDYLDTMYTPIYVFSTTGTLLTDSSSRNYMGAFIGPDNKLIFGGYLQNISVTGNPIVVEYGNVDYVDVLTGFYGTSVSFVLTGTFPGLTNYTKTVTVYGKTGSGSYTSLGGHSVTTAVPTASWSTAIGAYDTFKYTITGTVASGTYISMAATYVTATQSYYTEICELPGENVDYLLTIVQDETTNATVSAYINGVFQNIVTLPPAAKRKFDKNFFQFSGGNDFLLSKSKLRGIIGASDRVYPVLITASHIFLSGFTNDVDTYLTVDEIEYILKYQTKQIYGQVTVFPTTPDFTFDNYRNNSLLSVSNYSTGVAQLRNKVSLPIDFPEGEVTFIFPDITRTTYMAYNKPSFGWPPSVIFHLDGEIYEYSTLPNSPVYEAINSENITKLISTTPALSKYLDTTREYNNALGKWYTKITTKGIDPAQCAILILAECYHI